tara:strand:+ start:1087 stop:2052 length:966 start_codon:yes stop_codon:yes gene_type:complete
MDNLKKLKIGVVAGGISSEREISLKSGGAVHESLSKNGFSSKLIDIKSHEQLKSLETYKGLDLVFIMIHGKGGEDGEIQSVLKKAKIKYTGSNATSSRRAFDKVTSKEIFKKNGLEVPFHWCVWVDEEEQFEDYEGRRIVVKPSKEGSSYGVSIVNRPGKTWFDEDENGDLGLDSDLKEALLKADSYDGEIMVEDFIEGKELTVAIVGENTYPAIEIIPPNEFYDFSAKYDGIGTKYIPANLSLKETKKLSELCLRAFKSLGCSGWGRVDLIKSKDSGNYYILEVNTVPGMTETSLVPKAAKLAGLSFNDLLVEIIKASID